jgi:CBS domain-containing protein
VSCPPQTPIRDVLKRMHEDRIGSMVVVDADARPTGIFTQPDVLERVMLAGRSLDEPISTVMTPEPIVTPAEATASEGALVMARHGIRHLILVEGGRLAGVVSERDLFALQRTSVRRSAETIRTAASVDALAGAALAVRDLTRSLTAQGMGAEQLTLVVTALNDAIVRRALDLSIRNHAPGGRWCWIGLGSEGRMEQTFATDQDNALILGEGADAAGFVDFAHEANQILDRCGFPLCRGDIMARNPKWCLPLDAWRGLFLGWIRNPEPQALLGAAIFFDLRALGGDDSLAGELSAWLLDKAAASPMFLRAMAVNALEIRPPLGLLTDFVTERSTIDLKKLGTRPFVDVARVWALGRKVTATSTTERLRAAGLPADECEASVGAFHFIQSLRLRHAQNLVDPESLNVLDRRILKEAFRQAAKMQERLRLDYNL